jgi:hypothetical protein
MIIKKEITKQEYKFNTIIFNTYIILLCLIAVAGYFAYGTDSTNHIYMKCTNIRCENPYYNSFDCGTKLPRNEKICYQEFFVKDETYGTPPPKILILFPYLAILGLILCFIINHLLYNKDFNKKQFWEEIRNAISNQK